MFMHASRIVVSKTDQYFNTILSYRVLIMEEKYSEKR